MQNENLHRYLSLLLIIKYTSIIKLFVKSLDTFNKILNTKAELPQGILDRLSPEYKAMYLSQKIEYYMKKGYGVYLNPPDFSLFNEDLFIKYLEYKDNSYSVREADFNQLSDGNKKVYIRYLLNRIKENQYDDVPDYAYSDFDRELFIEYIKLKNLPNIPLPEYLKLKKDVRRIYDKLIYKKITQNMNIKFEVISDELIINDNLAIPYSNYKLFSLKSFFRNFPKHKSIRIRGSFNCSNIGLKTLYGSPQIIEGAFDCSENELKSLKHGPSILKKGDYNCRFNNLISLYGSPKVIHGNFICDNNELTTLKSAPIYVKGNFKCSNNYELSSIDGCPQQVDYNFQAENTKLTHDQIENMCNVNYSIYTTPIEENPI